MANMKNNQWRQWRKSKRINGVARNEKL